MAKNRKMLAALLALVMVLTLAACSNAPVVTPQPSEE